MAAVVKRAYKFRFYPTPEQADNLSRTFGCVRKVYNLALQARRQAWQERGEKIGYTDTSAMLTAWKQTGELAFLNEVSCVPLQQTLRHLNSAWGNFFAKRARHPRFKSKRRSRASAEYTRSGFRYRDGSLTLAKHAEPLAIVWSRPLPVETEPSTVTVSRDPSGRWFVSILVEQAVGALPTAGPAVGIDVGISHLATLSTGEKIPNPRHLHRGLKALARAQKNMARKEKGSANRQKARVRVARIHARLGDARRDHLHQVTTRLVRENQTLVIEDLNVAGMLRNRKLARHIADASWRQFRSQLEYKAAWYGRTVVVIGRFEPTSKRCSACRTVQEELPLSVREWTCRCGAVHDRDVNAARNILAAGHAVTACGADVRQPRPPRVRSAMKQEVVPTPA